MDSGHEEDATGHPNCKAEFDCSYQTDTLKRPKKGKRGQAGEREGLEGGDPKGELVVVGHIGTQRENNTPTQTKREKEGHRNGQEKGGRLFGKIRKRV